MRNAPIKPDLSAFRPPPVITLTSEGADWSGAYLQQYTAPSFGTFDVDIRESDPLSISWAQTAQKVRWRPRKWFDDVPLEPVLYMPGQGGRGEWQGAATTLLLYISKQFIQRALQTTYPLRRPARSEGRSKQVMHLMSLLRADVAAGSLSGPEVGEYLITRVVHALFPDDERSSALEIRRTAHRAIDRAREVVDARLSERLSLVELAAEVGMSARHLCRAFRSATGFAPHEYIVQRRVERAATLISLGKMSLTDIALLVGFSSHAHMVAAFRRVAGAPPSHFRNR